MILSPHLLMAKDGRYVVVVRHPEGVKPNALRHDVLYIAGKLVRSQRLSDAERVERLLAAARAWIAARAAERDTLPAVPGYGLVDRLKRYKVSRRDSRDKMAALVRAARQKPPPPRQELEAEYGAKAVQVAFKRWPRLRAGYPRSRQRARGGSRITTGGHASRTLLETLLAIAAKLKEQPTWAELAASSDPPLTDGRLHRHLELLRDSFKLDIDDRRKNIVVWDWGLLREDRL